MDELIEWIGILIVMVVGILAVIFSIVGVLSMFDPTESEIRNELAHQIYEGTHEVVWSTNEFGTLEVRIEEVKGTK